MTDKTPLFLNSLARLTAFTVPLLLTLLLTPHYLSHLGADGYGRWALVLALIGLSHLFDWGIGIATTRHLTQEPSDYQAERAALLFTSFTLYICLAVVGATVLLLAGDSITQLLQADSSSSLSAKPLTRLAAFILFTNMFRQYAEAVLAGHDRYDLKTLLYISYDTLFKVGMAIIVTFTSNLFVVFAWLSIIALLTAGTGLYIVRHLLPASHTTTVHFSYDDATNLLTFSGHAGTASFGARLFNVLDRLLVGALIGPSAVSLYVIAVGVANKLYSLSRNATDVLIPRISHLQLQGSTSRIQSIFYRVNDISLWLLLPLSSLLYVNAGPLFSLWLGPDFGTQLTPLFRIVLVAYSLLALSPPAVHYANALGHPQINSSLYLAGGILSIGAIATLGSRGILYVAWANYGLCIVLLSVPLICRTINISFASLLRRHFLRPVLIYTAIIVGYHQAPPKLPFFVTLIIPILLWSPFAWTQWRDLYQLAHRRLAVFLRSV